MKSWFLPLAWLLPVLSYAGIAQTTPQRTMSTPESDLRYVVVLSRHGVRSPTGKAAQYDRFSVGQWPEWPVEPGYLTPHGFKLMQLFGEYDRSQFASQSLLQPAGCADAAHITIYADSDERTRETGKALAQGLMPGCELPVGSLPEGTNDPLFHPHPDPQDHAATALAVAAIAGRVGSEPANITHSYQLQIGYLDHILATCGIAPAGKPARASLFDIPATLVAGTGDHLADLKGPLYTASTLSENLLLEYTQGMDDADVGWGCVHHDELNNLLQLHAAAVDFSQRTPVIARAQAGNLLDVIRLSLQQAAAGRPVPGAKGKATDKALILVGHDTNIENIAGALDLTWVIDGRRDDTPPGGALSIELWQNRANHQYSVRLSYTAQTLNQMRNATALTLSNPPQRVAVFIPSCSEADTSCSLAAFSKLIDFHDK